ncbi:MAG: helix-turn-helix transcriptional regulator [Gammaproteobacteria bacterium]|nr:helix-turn-helix transcriptional regulator [Gammaproteobacteria bacterium]
MSEVIQYPRRTERRNQINRRLAAAAVRLFERQGYARTKLAEVAEEADVHVQTLYKHFKTKEELARAAAAVSIEDCRAHFERAPKDHSTFQVWREWIGKNVHRRHSGSSDNFMAITYSGYEDLLTEQLARDFALAPERSPLPRMAACMLWASNEAAVKMCAGSDGENTPVPDSDRLVRECLAVIDEAEKLFAHCLK